MLIMLVNKPYNKKRLKLNFFIIISNEEALNLPAGFSLTLSKSADFGLWDPLFRDRKSIALLNIRRGLRRPGKQDNLFFKVQKHIFQVFSFLEQQFLKMKRYFSKVKKFLRNQRTKGKNCFDFFF